jgi:hypothetical protein
MLTGFDAANSLRVIRVSRREPDPGLGASARLVPQDGLLFPLLRVISGGYRQF